MKKTVFLLLVVASLLALVATAFAQPPAGGGGGRGRGGGGGMTFGVIQVAGDNGATLAIQSTNRQGAVQLTTAKLDANTKLVEYVDCDVAQIKVGDLIAVGSGTPLKLRADNVQVGGPMRQFMMPPAAAVPAGQPGPPDPLAPMATGQLTGKVSSTQPLTVDVNGVAIEIETGAKTTIIKSQPIADATTFKANQKVLVLGQRDQATNTVTARVVILDSTATGLQTMLRGGGMGMGGPGGPGGGGGRGGRGGGGNAAPAGAAPAGGGPGPAVPLPAPGAAK